jgi:ABC-type multidrug transport system ATPase subunit
MPCRRHPGLSKRYGDFDAVANLELQVPAGELFALLGPTAPARRRRSAC